MLGLLAGTALPGCSWFGDAGEEPQQLDFSGADEARAPRGREPVVSVERLEIGRTASGLALVARGVAPGSGYARPRLIPRREGAPGRDAMLDFDFVVTPPDPDRNLPEGDSKVRRVRADTLLSPGDLRGARGIRVHGLRGGAEIRF